MIGFNMVEPVEAELVSSNVPSDASEGPWSALVEYEEAQTVDHGPRVYESLQDANTNHEPGATGSELWWVDVGPSNAYAMFDQSIQTQSVAEDTIEVELEAPASARVDVVFLQNLEAKSVSLAQTDPTDGEVFAADVDLTDNSGITNILAYLTAPFRRRDWALIEPLGVYDGSTFEIVVDNTGAEAKCGDCVIGRKARMGLTLMGGESGSIDFSTKERDLAGGFEIVERGFADTNSHQVLVKRADWDLVKRLLTDARAQRRVWIAYAGHGSTIVNGYVTSWRLLYSTQTHYALSIELESLA